MSDEALYDDLFGRMLQLEALIAAARTVASNCADQGIVGVDEVRALRAFTRTAKRLEKNVVDCLTCERARRYGDAAPVSANAERKTVKND